MSHQPVPEHLPGDLGPEDPRRMEHPVGNVPHGGGQEMKPGMSGVAHHDNVGKKNEQLDERDNSGRADPGTDHSSHDPANDASAYGQDAPRGQDRSEIGGHGTSHLGTGTANYSSSTNDRRTEGYDTDRQLGDIDARESSGRSEGVAGRPGTGGMGTALAGSANEDRGPGYETAQGYDRDNDREGGVLGGRSHATGHSMVPGAIQDAAPRGLEEALPDRIHDTSSQGRNTTGGYGGSDYDTSRDTSSYGGSGAGSGLGSGSGYGSGLGSGYDTSRDTSGRYDQTSGETTRLGGSTGGLTGGLGSSGLGSSTSGDYSTPQDLHHHHDESKPIGFMDSIKNAVGLGSSSTTTGSSGSGIGAHGPHTTRIGEMLDPASDSNIGTTGTSGLTGNTSSTGGYGSSAGGYGSSTTGEYSSSTGSGLTGNTSSTGGYGSSTGSGLTGNNQGGTLGGQSHATGHSYVPQSVQEALPESVERAVPDSIHDTSGRSNNY